MPYLEEVDDELNLIFWCPGCNMYHGISTNPPAPMWEFNGNRAAPTFHPSLMIKMGPECNPYTGLAIKGQKDRVCHSFIVDGEIRFLNDCTHKLAGKTVKMVYIDDK